MNIDTLILRSEAKNQLLQIRDIEFGLDYLSKVKAIETWAKAEKLDAEMQTLIAEQKLRTQRIIGKLIQEGQERGEIASQKSDMGNQYKVLPSTEEYSKPRTLSDIGLTAKESHIYQKIADIPEEDFETYIADKKQAIDKNINELTTAGMLHFANTGAHVSNNSGDNEWYTPKEIIESAKAVMGDIDIDPASSKEANEIIQARKYYTTIEDGLCQEWAGRVWLNPPYSQPGIMNFMLKLKQEITEKRTTSALVLVNNATETEWFQILAKICVAICFPSGRLKFWSPDKVSVPLQGQAIAYIGMDIKRFREEFKRYGFIVIIR